MWHIDDILRAVKGVPLRVERETFTGISTDSRTIREGELFIPIHGKLFDGHHFVEKAYEQSHGGCLCEKSRKDLLGSVAGTIVLVDDTTQALLDLAYYRRRQVPGTYAAITGSNGKTTTKEILVTILQRAGKVHWNEKNFNNLIGVSKSLLDVKEDPDFLIFELGTNSKGEIKRLAQVVEPDVSLITNVNPSHLEGLGDLHGVLDEKLDLFRHTKPGGHILINVDDAALLSYCAGTKLASHTFGVERNAEFRLHVEQDLGWSGYECRLNLSGTSVRVTTPLLGTHNLYNILSAASMAHVMGISTEDIGKGIEAFRPCAMRFEPIMTKMGYTVVNDSYNANPASVKWAIHTLSKLPCAGKRIAILGEMKELGSKSAHYHEELGKFLRESNIDKVILIGEEVKEILKELSNGRARIFDSKTLLIDYVKSILSRGDTVLVKGSRASKMEDIVEALV